MPAILEVAVQVPSSLGPDATLELHDGAANVDVDTPLLGPLPAFGQEGAMPFLSFTRTPLGTGTLGDGILGGVPPYPAYLPLGSGFLGDGFLGAGATRFKFTYRYVFSRQDLDLKVVARDALGNRTGTPYEKTYTVVCAPRPPQTFVFKEVVDGKPVFSILGSLDDIVTELNLYRRTTPTGTATLVVTLDNDDLEFTDNEYPGGLCYYSLSATADGLESNETELVNVYIVGGVNVGLLPNVPLFWLRPLAAGKVGWTINYDSLNQMEEPSYMFIIYTVDGTDPEVYSGTRVFHPPGGIDFPSGIPFFERTSVLADHIPAQTTGTVVKARALAIGDAAQFSQSEIVTVTCDATGPAQPDFSLDTILLKW